MTICEPLMAFAAMLYVNTGMFLIVDAAKYSQGTNTLCEVISIAFLLVVVTSNGLLPKLRRVSND